MQEDVQHRLQKTPGGVRKYQGRFALVLMGVSLMATSKNCFDYLHEHHVSTAGDRWPFSRCHVASPCRECRRCTTGMIRLDVSWIDEEATGAICTFAPGRAGQADIVNAIQETCCSIMASLG
jgi:hypothetical protein